MTNTISRNFRLYNAKQLYESISESDPTKFYIFVGRGYAWANDSAPPTPNDTVSNTSFDYWRGVFASKKVGVNDVSFAIKRYDWESGTVYSQYKSDDTGLYDRNFYVLTDDNNVYKCLSNNRGATSTVKPTGTNTGNIKTSDGYIWKFMYSLSAADSLKFLTPEFIPLKSLSSDDGSAQWQVRQAAANGSIQVIGILNTGNSYSTDSGTLTAVANGTNVTLANTASSAFNFYNNNSLYIDGGLGSGQISKIIDYDGSTKQVTLQTALTTLPNTSSTYSISPTIEIVGDGTGAKAYSNVISGAITDVNMISTGSGYSYARTTISANSGVGGVVKPYISPPNGHGYDPVSEFGAHNVILNVRLDSTESNTILADSSIRTIALVADPIQANTGLSANGVNYDLTTTLNITSISGTFTEGEMINGQTTLTNSRVYSYANTTTSTGALRVTDVRDGFITNEIITGNTSGARATISTIQPSELIHYRGDVLYIENRTPITRAIEQVEDVKLIIKF